MPDRQVRHTLQALDAPLSRLASAPDELVKAWLLRLVQRASLQEIERLPTDRMVRELPEIVAALLGSLHSDHATNGALKAVAAEQASRMADFRASAATGGGPSELARDVAALHSVILGAVGRELGVREPEAMVAAAERLAELFGAVQAAAVEELVRDRSRELEWLANTDALTGLYNVRYLRQHLRHLVGVQGRYGHPFAVLVLDVDGLKRVNDAHGHAAGDELLIAVASAMRETVRSIDTPVRMGGDEFCVLAPHQTADRARQLGERLAAAAERHESPLGAPVAVSIGVVSCPQHSVDPERLLELADEAMYRAKAAGTGVSVGEPDGTAAANGERNGR